MGINKNELNEKTARELRNMAKELNISGRWDMTKEELIEAIAKKSGEESTVETEPVESEEAKSDEVKEASEIKEAEESAEVKEEAPKKDNKESLLRHLSSIKKGTMVAFKINVCGNVRAKSAAVKNVSQSRRMLKLETSYGKEYIVSFDDVLWIRYNSRWPRFIYNMLKGVTAVGY